MIQIESLCEILSESSFLLWLVCDSLLIRNQLSVRSLITFGIITKGESRFDHNTQLLNSVRL